eukprot:GEMP01042636.1.p1 GENE.GEMP01042636.1~~GEMP01042636.1.p1  ORF type:complete len:323 (-),score=36.40 GEMP01042636.1:708-1676(-)
MRLLWISTVFVAFARESELPAGDSPTNVQAVPQPIIEKMNPHLRSSQSVLFEETVLEDGTARRNLNDEIQTPKYMMMPRYQRRSRVNDSVRSLFVILLFILMVAIGFVLTFDGYRLETTFYFTIGFVVGLTWGDSVALNFPEFSQNIEELGFSITLQGLLFGLALGAAMAYGRKTINAFAAGLLGMFIAQLIWNVFPVETGDRHMVYMVHLMWLLLGFFIGAYLFPHLASMALCFMCSVFGGFILAFAINIVFGFARGSNLIQGSFVDSFRKVMHLHLGDLHDTGEDQTIFILVWGCIAILGFLYQLREIHDDYGTYTPVRQ